MRSDETIPLFLWRLAWGGLYAVLVAGLATLVVLAGGAADPSRAGPLVYQSESASIIPLPTGPYTLEVTGRFTQTTDPAAVWGVELTDSNVTPLSNSSPVSVPLRILINGYGFFALPPLQPDFTPFIHIRTHGESNKLSLNVGNGGEDVLRINDEIAWKGNMPPARSAAIWRSAGTQFTLDRIALYAP